ncbi:MAG: cation transporter, partial [Pseudomonadota bacterium]
HSDHSHQHSHSENPPAAGGFPQGEDHNLKAAYLHVLADAVTSLLAIAALLAGKHYGANWLDPFMGIVGGVLVTRWSLGLIKDTSRILLDAQADATMVNTLTNAIEAHSSDKISDLHLWNIGDGLYALELVVVSEDPQPPDHYKALIPESLAIAHATIEVHQCPRG